MPPKKARSDGPPPLSNRDHMERANFAIQASMFLQQLGTNAAAGPSSSSGSTSTSALFPAPVIIDRKGKRRAVEVEVEQSRNADFSRIARNQIRAFKKWTVHNQVKIDPSVKRTLCACNTVLVPGLTTTVRRRKDKIYHVCTVCGASRSLPLVAAGNMDDIIPARRRRENAKVPFHERERPLVLQEEEPTDKKKGKAKRQETPTAGGDVSGHVLWRGSERCSGWGVAQETADGKADAGASRVSAAESGEGDEGGHRSLGASSKSLSAEPSAEELEACG